MFADFGELICSRIRFFEWRLTGKYVYHAYQVYRGSTRVHKVHVLFSPFQFYFLRKQHQVTHFETQLL